MRTIKLAPAIIISMSLAACSNDSDHGFEGEYRGQTQSSVFGNTSTRSHTLVVGANYLDINGNRVGVEEISVRELGDQSQLVFEFPDGEEESLEIIDEDTLKVNLGLSSIEMERIQPHGFEGEYQGPDGTIVIGYDFMGDEDYRDEAEKIFVRDSEEQRHLIFEYEGGGRMIFDIVDDNTLRLADEPEIELQRVQ